MCVCVFVIDSLVRLDICGHDSSVKRREPLNYLLR